MRRVRYAVAASLDGFIAGPNGEADWIVMDPDIDFKEIFDAYDTLLIGRRTFELMAKAGQGSMPGMKVLVFSRTLRQSDYPKVTIVGDNVEKTVETLREEPGKDIWLFGGGDLFRSLAGAGLVDSVEVAIIPVMLGGGIPLLPPPANRVHLKLTSHKVFEKTGIVTLEYAVQAKPAQPRRTRKSAKQSAAP
jgi:dihydrofolate reductase